MSLDSLYATTSTAPSRPAASATVRSNMGDTDAQPSFGDVLSRARGPDEASAETPQGKPAKAPAARSRPEPSLESPADPQDLLAALSLNLVAVVPPETPALPALPARNGVAADASVADLAAQANDTLNAASAKEASLIAPAVTTSADKGEEALSSHGKPDKSRQAVRPNNGAHGTSATGPGGTGTMPESLQKTAATATAMAPADRAETATSSIGTSAQAPPDLSGSTNAQSSNAAMALLPSAAFTPGDSSISAPTSVAVASLAPQVGDSDWGKALSQQLVHMTKSGQQVAELQLNPPGLGPLKVTLSMNEQQVQAMFASAHSSVRAAVEAALPQLRATLADNGLSLNNTWVSADSQQQSAFARPQDDNAHQTSSRNDRLQADNTSLAPRAVPELMRRDRGLMIDTWA